MEVGRGEPQPQPQPQPQQDRLSSLPADILIENILSLLPMREAARTSILSSPWRFLGSSVPRLDLDGSRQVLPYPRRNANKAELAAFKRSARRASSEYADWVDSVIRAYRGTFPLRSFRVLFRMSGSFQERIHGWLFNFCFKEGVLALDLQLGTYSFLSNSQYEFPVIQPSLYPENVKLLRSLTLSGLVLTDGALENLLSACPCLEILHLRSVHPLTAIKVTGPESRLKSLHVLEYLPLKSVEIYSPTPDLVSFHANSVKVHIESAPRLLDLFIPSGLDIFTHTSHPLFRYISQLETLHLPVSNMERGNEWLPTFPDLSRIKHLKLGLHYQASARSGILQQLQYLESLIAQLTSLQHLTLEVEGLGRNLFIGEQEARLQLQPLRVIELVGFRAREIECDFALHFIKYAPSLEKLIIDCREPSGWGDRGEYPRAAGTIKNWRRNARNRIRPGLPSNAELVFL